jgi:serine/threonine protein phosphatase 1
MTGWSKKRKGPPRTPRGRRAYAIGDVHGRLDLLEQLLDAIERDVEDRRSVRQRWFSLATLSIAARTRAG